MFYETLLALGLEPGQELDFGDGQPSQSQASRVYQRNQMPIGMFRCKPRPPIVSGTRHVGRPGCALCGELVETPHWCVKRYDDAHAHYVAGNDRYRLAMYQQRLEESDHDLLNHEPRQGILDLAEWGDWTWCQEQGYAPFGVDVATAQRADRVVQTLTVDARRELRSVYVTRCEAVRTALRSKRKAPGEAVARVKQKLPVLTTAELSYLQAIRAKRVA